MTRAALAALAARVGPARDAVREGTVRPPFYCELGSGFGAVLCGVLSWAGGTPLETHPVFGTIARLVGDHAVQTVWVTCGAAQIAAVVLDRWPWRWIAALGMMGGWSVPVLQALKNGADAPIVAGACLAWVCVNAAAARSLMRRGCRGTG